MSRFENAHRLLAGESDKYGNLPGYTAFSLAFAGYATPTDLISLRNPVGSGKIINTRTMGLWSRATAATLMIAFYYRRAALNTGGTPTDLTPVKLASRLPTPVGVPRLYGAAPVIVDVTPPPVLQTGVTTGALANLGSNLSFNNIIPFGANAVHEIINPCQILPGEELVMNFASAALPAGFTSVAHFCWSESNL